MQQQQNEDTFIFDLNKDFEEEEDNNDLITIQLSSSSFQVYYFQICKYSQLIQNKFPKNEAKQFLSQYIQEISEQYNINENNIIIFFKMLQEEKVQI